MILDIVRIYLIGVIVSYCTLYYFISRTPRERLEEMKAQHSEKEINRTWQAPLLSWIYFVGVWIFIIVMYNKLRSDD